MGVMSVKDREAAIEALREVNGVVDRAREVLEADAAISALTRRGAVDMEALAAFAEAAAEVLGDEPLSVPAARRAGLLAAAGHAWENELGPLSPALRSASCSAAYRASASTSCCASAA